MSYAPFDLDSRTAVVIGGTLGDRAIAYGLAEAGADSYCQSLLS